MNWIVYCFLFLSLSQCGKIEIEHTYSVNDAQLQKYFGAKCRKDLGPDAPQDSVDQCTNEAIGEFLSSLK